MDWQRLARANTHPLRISVLEVLAMDGGRILSPSDLSYELRVPLSNVNYHVTELVKSSLIELASQRQVRGATEHFYRLVDHANGTGHSNGASGNGHHPEKRTTLGRESPRRVQERNALSEDEPIELGVKAVHDARRDR